MRSSGIFGETGRFSLTISPGIVRDCEDNAPAGELRVCARASGPLPSMRVTNGTLSEASVFLSVTNLQDSPRWAVYLEPLFESEPQDQRCLREPIGPTAGLATRLADADGALLTALVPACSALVFSAQIPALEARKPYQIMVLGGGSVRPSELRTALAVLEASSYTPDFIWFTDLLALQSTAEAYDALNEAMEETGIPWGILMNEEAVSRGPDRFVDTFGSLDYVTGVHGVPFVVLDTASWTLSTPQISYLERMRTCATRECPPSVALMSVAPVSVRRLDVGLFRSHIVAHNLLASLAERGVRWVISGKEATPHEANFGGFELVDTGAWRGMDEFLSVEVHPPAPSLPLCDAGLSLMTAGGISVTSARFFCEDGSRCVGGVCVEECEENTDCARDGNPRCVQGLCRIPCESDACGGAACDASGFCIDGPQVTVGKAVLGE